MFDRLVAAVLIATICLSTSPAASAQQPSSTFTVPAGTVVPLTLVTPIKSKSTRPGDTVRAAVAFPVTVGDRVVIPQGTYVEGVLLPSAPKVKHQPDPGVQVHFTRLVFSNGYSIPLDATQASSVRDAPPLPPSPSPAQPPATPLFASFDPFAHDSFVDAMTPQELPSTGWQIPLLAQSVPTLPALPPLPHQGPNVGLFVGLAVGVPAAFVILGILFHHKAGTADYIVHDVGWQFQMRLATPLSLNANQVALASQTVPAQ